MIAPIVARCPSGFPIWHICSCLRYEHNLAASASLVAEAIRSELGATTFRRGNTLWAAVPSELRDVARRLQSASDTDKIRRGMRLLRGALLELAESAENSDERARAMAADLAAIRMFLANRDALGGS